MSAGHAAAREAITAPLATSAFSQFCIVMRSCWYVERAGGGSGSGGEVDLLCFCGRLVPRREVPKGCFTLGVCVPRPPTGHWHISLAPQCGPSSTLSSTLRCARLLGPPHTRAAAGIGRRWLSGSSSPAWLLPLAHCREPGASGLLALHAGTGNRNARRVGTGSTSLQDGAAVLMAASLSPLLDRAVLCRAPRHATRATAARQLSWPLATPRCRSAHRTP
jgi:hypothetical protein